MSKTNFFAAAHALIQKDNEYLVTKRSKLNRYMPLKWDIPGGTVEPGETIEAALLREVSEETKLRIKVIRPIHIYTNLDQFPKRQTFQVVFLCDYIDGDINLSIFEHKEFKWLPWDEIKKLDTIAFLTDLIGADPIR